MEKENIFFAVEKKNREGCVERENSFSWRKRKQNYFPGGKENRSKGRKTFGEGKYIFAEEKEKEKIFGNGNIFICAKQNILRICHIFTFVTFIIYVINVIFVIYDIHSHTWNA